MVDNPIKYADLIQPDDSITKAISQLEKLSETYANMLVKLKNEAATLEVSIKKVNGATTGQVITMINLKFIKWIAIAFALAVPFSYYIMHRWLENFAYKTGMSWWIFVLAGALAMGIALLTVSWQSWRAASKNPVEVLRYE